MKKIFLVTNIPTPYRIPLFNELALQLSNAGYHMKVIFSARGYEFRKWEIDWDSIAFDYVVLGGGVKLVGDRGRYRFGYPGLVKMVRLERPAAIICPGFSIASTVMRFVAPILRIPFIVWSGATARRAQMTGERSVLRKLQRKSIVRGASSFVAYGSEAREYLISLGASPNDVFVGINTVETAFFQNFSKTNRGTKIASASTRFLCITTLIPGKQVDTLIAAAVELQKGDHNFAIHIVGDGPLRNDLEALAKAKGVSDLIKFRGYLQREQVARELADASAFLFPTEIDVWGLVLVEAMAAGLPSIASVHAGATCDLIDDGKTGYSVDFKDCDTLCDRMTWIIANPDEATAMGLRGQQKIEVDVSLEKSANGFVRAIEHGTK